MGQEVTFGAFLDSVEATLEPRDTPALSLPNLGSVEFTTVTKGNLALLRRAQSSGYPGLLISCPDFEREAIAVAFLAALLHIEFDSGEPGLHEPISGEKAAVGKCVVKINEVSSEKVMYASLDQTAGIATSIRPFPLVHRASPDAELSRTKSTKKRKYPSLLDEAKRYEELPDA